MAFLFGIIESMDYADRTEQDFGTKCFLKR